MGREATGREVNYLEAGMEVFGMELLDTQNVETSVRAAIEAAVATARRAWSRDIRDDVMEKSEDLDNDPDCDLNGDGVAALLWYAYLLDEELPPEQQLGGI